MTISEDGILAGTYSNGTSRPLYRLPLAHFPDRAALGRLGESLFLETPGSGKPTVSAGRGPQGGAIRSGAVEVVTDAERARVCAGLPDC